MARGRATGAALQGPAEDFSALILDFPHHAVIGKTESGLAVPDNEVIEQIDVHEGADQIKIAGQFPVLSRGLQAARGVIMGHHQGRGQDDVRDKTS